MIVRCLLALCLLLGACFEPKYPVGLPCSENRTCPPGQTCDLDGICRIDPLSPSPTCGDGIVDSASGEVCDDGNNLSGDGCSADCRSIEVCGNGIVDSAAGEACDDGNNIGGDGCSADCRLESCGNGDLDPGESCDDGNNTGGDECPANCVRDEQQCGNGLLEPNNGEVCDDGNNISGDGCSADCSSTEVCGNGIVDGAVGEACDDGNTEDDDGCSGDCRLRGLCGNGMVDLDLEEECDDAGNSDTCDADCTAAQCGDSFINPVRGEVCDDGNNVNEDQCTAECALASCSDGFRNADELDADCGGHCGPGSCDLGQMCGGNADCASALCSMGRCTVAPRLVFVTSELFDGNLGGVAGADAHCQRLAEAAGRAGTFRAWISDTNSSPSTRFTRSDGQYVLADGTVIADSYTDLTDGTIDNRIRLTELGTAPPPAGANGCQDSPTIVWSGTGANGGGIPVPASQLCQNWTSAAASGQWGNAEFSNTNWSSWCSGGTCEWRASLYCMQQ